MLRRFSINFALLSIILDSLVIAACLKLAEWMRPALNKLNFVKEIPTDVQVPAILFLLFPLIWVLVFLVFSIYDGRKHFRIASEFAVLSLSSLLAGIAMAGVLYLSFRDISRVLYLIFFGSSYLGLALLRVISRLFFRIQQDTLNLTRRVLIVGTGGFAREISGILKREGAEMISFLGYIAPEDAPEFRDEQILGPVKELRSIIQDVSATDVLIALPRSSEQKALETIGFLQELPIQVWVALDYLDLSMNSTGIESLAGVPLLDLRAPALSDYQRLIKRGFDLIFSLCAILLISPVLLITAFLILITDGKPVLFIQNRVGENGNLFRIFKFRTMVKNAEELQEEVSKVDENGNLIHKTRDDFRITAIGRILRRFSIDELPQFFNVLLGNMSVVGPRPELPEIVNTYDAWQRSRLAVPPGITGWWQIHGRSEKMMHLHTEQDIYYVQNYSIWLDLQIIVRTVWVVLFGKGAF